VRFERHHSTLIIASLVTVASFAGASAYSQRGLARLDALSSTLESNAIPSIELLSGAAVHLTRLNQFVDEAADVGHGRATAIAAAQAEADAADADATDYLRLQPLAGEQALWEAMRAANARALQLVRAALATGQRLPGVPLDEASRDAIDDALDAAVRAVLTTLDFDVHQSESMAHDVSDVRAATVHTIAWLDVAAALIAMIAVVIAYRASRQHDRLEAQHAALLADRVTELDRFAGRIAHDVLSPLGVVSTGLALLGRSADARSAIYVERSQRALQHVQQLVDGLLTFARSGARPDASSTCAVTPVIANVVADCTETASANGVEIVVDAAPALHACCSVGVLTSIVQNLVRNALKYLGARTVRRITIRATASERMVRLEVEDTGPGIPPDLQRVIFEPFVRGPNETASGAGIGLATVKRLVESHSGRVAVQSTPGEGSLFWVELPRARPAGPPERT
jgi:signal transduction histidine kinase